jgi:hypothetical protein
VPLFAGALRLKAAPVRAIYPAKALVAWLAPCRLDRTGPLNPMKPMSDNAIPILEAQNMHALSSRAPAGSDQAG